MKRIFMRSLWAALLIMMFCPFLIAADGSATAGKVFSDVSEGSWYETGTNYCFTHGYISGTAEGEFSPRAPLTRAMSVQILYAMEEGEAADSSTFTDVLRGKWYFDAVEWAYKNDIAHGTGIAIFSPAAEITRQDFVTMLYGFCTAFSHDAEIEHEVGLDLPFSDHDDISDYAKDAVEWAIENSILAGFPDGTLRPKSSISRSETAVIIAAYDSVFGHEWQESVITKRTCESDGHSEFRCAVCERVRTVKTKGYHLWNGGVVTTPAKCFADGLRTTTCISCGKSYTEPIPAIGRHVFGDWMVYIPADLYTTGTKVRYCRYCGRGEAHIYRCDSYYQLQDGIDLPSGGYDLSTKNIGMKVIYTNLRLLGTDSASFTSATFNAVKRFQKSCGLPQTGIVDLSTWLAMGYSEYDWYNLGRYITPQKTSVYNSRQDHINTMINTAWEYAAAGTEYRIGCSGAPGTYADCSGLIYQCLYSVGIDPDTDIILHALAEYEYTSRWLAADPKLGLSVPTNALEAGDLVFYAANGKSTVVHVALYTGDGMIYDAWPKIGTTYRSINIPGYYVIKAVRVFP